jgi:hypothetical protein
VVPGIDESSGKAYFYHKKTRKSVWSFGELVKEMGLDDHGEYACGSQAISMHG